LKAKQGKQRKTGFKHVDPLAVLNGLKVGKTQSAIAKEQGLNVSSINRFLAKIKPHFVALEEFTVHQGKALTYTLARSQRIQHKYMDEIERQIEENRKMVPSKRQTLGENLKGLGKMTWVHAVTFDKHRLEGGLSTSNVSLAGMVKHAHEVSPFNPATGEFKASVVNTKPTSRLDESNTSIPLVENESNQ